MKLPVLGVSLYALGLLAACAPSRATTPAGSGPAPVSRAPNANAPTAPNVPAYTADEPAQDWHLRDVADGAPGIGLRRTERELLANRQPRRQVLVAVIDGGVDTAHTDLRGNLWTNPKETPGNRADDDGNGLADDVFGWNFIGGANGRSVDHDTYEVTRLYARCSARALGGDSLTTFCPRVTAEYAQARNSAERESGQIQRIAAAMDSAMRVLRGALGDSVTPARVRSLSSGSAPVQRAKSLYLQLAASDITPQAIAEAKTDVENRLAYGLNPQYNPRPTVGDDPANLTERRYGNGDVMGPDAKHGTHVAGIVGAIRGNSAGMDGVASNVRIMMVRAVPDGDERDKDIANAIRYATDQGAQIINMSFGKGWSPNKSVVDDAVRYADSKGVLLVHAAGNEGEDIAQKPSFPTPFYTSGGRANNWIEVGASSWKGGDKLASSFSNYSSDRVDVFAPGSDIYSTVPGGGYERLSGTSMAAPVVSGAAALLMSYFPELTAADVKRILLATATRYPNQRVIRPGGEAPELVPFSSLSATGGIVNVYAAVKMALAGVVRQD